MRVTISQVTDGDTVEVTPAIGGEEDVRLIGVDTPEVAGSPAGPQPYAEQAAAYAERTLAGRRATLEFDVEKKDDYGRVLAYVRLDGGMFNRSLLREGYAQVATFPPNTRYRRHFESDQAEARAAQRGIWGLPEAESCRLADRGNGVGGGCQARKLPGFTGPATG